MRSIQTKVLSVVIAGLLVITAVVSAIAVTMMHRVMHKDADKILSAVAQKEAASINDALSDVSTSAAIMAHYAQSSVKKPEQLRNEYFLKNYLADTRQMFKEIALNIDRINGFYLRLNPEYTDSTTGYYVLITADRTLKDMQVTDLSKYAPDDTQNVSWYYTPVQKGTALWLEPYRFPGLETLLISYAVPLYAEGELLGVLGFDMNFESLVEYVADISVYDRGYAVLVGTDAEQRYHDYVDVVDGRHPAVSAKTRLDNGMYLELHADYRDIQHEIRPMLTKIVHAFLLVLAVAICYTVFVTRRIVKPLKQLTAAAEGLKVGGESKLDDIPIHAKDEIGTLSRVLKNTYEKISEYTVYINALAYRDPLTGIKNSTAYTETIDQINKEINCANAVFGVLIADINDLKQTNDRYGHDVGNELIVHAARILTDIFKTSLVFRIGGDEFAVILKGRDYSAYHKLIFQMDKACKEDHITVEDIEIPVFLARGVALFDPKIDRVYEDVFAKADHAMYLHKEQSKSLLV